MPIQIDYSCPDDAFVQGIDVLTLLPHRSPFVMVGRMEHFDMQSCTSSFIISADNAMVWHGALSETGMLENVAQTCALRIGYLNRYIYSREVRPGYIGAIDRVAVHSLPRVGERIETKVEVLAELSGYIMVHASVGTDDRVLLEADVRLAV